MRTPAKAFGIDPKARLLLSEAADTEIASKQFTSVGSSAATELKSDDASIMRRKLLVKSVSTTVTYIGDSGVDSTNGFPLYQYDEIELDVDVDGDVWARTASGTASVHILEIQ